MWKSGEHLRTTYVNNGQLFRTWYVSSTVYTLISTARDRTSDLFAETLQLGQQFISHTSDAKLTSRGNCAAN